VIGYGEEADAGGLGPSAKKDSLPLLAARQAACYDPALHPGRLELTMRAARAVAFVVCAFVIAVAFGVSAARAQRQSSPAEARTRISPEQKIDPPLLREIYRRRGEAAAKHVPLNAAGVDVDRHGRAYVDVHAPVTSSLTRKISALGGRVVASSPQYQTLTALMPVTMVERLAADRNVRSVTAAAMPR
jgi:hypothetical protein